MAVCKRCALNGQFRNGGTLGVCKTHAKSKCQICAAPSLGAPLCAAHSHQEETMRWVAKAQLRVIEPDSELDMSEIRREKLMLAKFLAHQAVEEFFRALLHAMQALWGIPAAEPPAKARGRKAA